MAAHELILTDQDKENICGTCGTRYKDTVPLICAVCADDRQYVPISGQRWISYNDLKNGRSIRFNEVLPDVYALRITPDFAIAQKAHVICSPGGNLLWDCLPFLDEPTVAYIHSLGGLKGIAISHPHYYSLMAGWAQVFNCPIYLHGADEEWVMDKSPHIKLWSGEKLALWDGMDIIHVAGHFAGSTVLHAPNIGASGSLFVGDSLYIGHSLNFVSMMHSYPNVIPLPQKDVLYIKKQVSPLQFDSMFGAFEWQNIYSGAKQIFNDSVARYLQIFE